MAELSQTAANVIGTGTQKRGISGASITAGMPVYVDADDDNKLKICQADAAGTANCDGIALNTASAGQPIAYQTRGPIDLGATVAVGTPYVVSDATAGKIRPHADLGTGDYVTILGVATAANSLALDIQNSATAHA